MNNQTIVMFLGEINVSTSFIHIDTQNLPEMIFNRLWFFFTILGKLPNTCLLDYFFLIFTLPFSHLKNVTAIISLFYKFQ